jgi:hypothetical protein
LNDTLLKVQVARERRPSDAPAFQVSFSKRCYVNKKAPSTTASKVAEFLKEGERVYASLASLLAAETIDIGELRLSLRALGRN